MCIRDRVRIDHFQLGQPLLQSQRVELVDGERSHAALCASRLADQPLAAAAGRIGEGRIDNLHQLLVARWTRDTHGKSITQWRLPEIFRVELAFRPASKPFITAPPPTCLLYTSDAADE